MTLDELIEPLKDRLQIVERRGDLQVPIADVTDDSRRVKPGALFVAVRGERADGHAYIGSAIRSGAGAVVVQSEVVDCEIPLIRVKDSRLALGLLGSRFYGNPSSRLRMIGVTGTNGKTTVTYVCKALLEAIGRRVGLVGTVAYLIGTEVIPASHTTPGALDLQALLARMVCAGVDSAVMEVSSHALALDRTVGCEFDVAVFTNLTQDHLDFHRDMDDYFQAKLKLFVGLSVSGTKGMSKRAVVNADDPRGELVRAACAVPVWTYSIRNRADIRAEDVHLSLDGTRFTAVTPAGRFPVESRLVGEHNVYNVLAAIGVALQEGLSPDEVRSGLEQVRDVPGRFERVEAGQDFTVVVDYAHTEDALVRLLTTAQSLKTGRIITVFGCGGDRDRGKRPKMGRAAVRYSDVVVLTSDNPRTEDPMAILREVEAGVREALAAKSNVRYEMIADRRQAIEAAVREARPGDMVLIAGKGHENYQIIGTTKFHFDDREVAREAILNRGVMRDG
ncbi:MAG TPA: UDP-N-acetylmuramoyl-L-alanyl-D-glutamate--2,6-diaminopimelate ligase [Nitrospiraceae bacterium]|jgi:UDP-N-acetylmuramoyl-L-alanyl-D-glutamate--2,6-diaminopimelate ligase|nr:UDP-N-acetylmuramoyl-L-alanyl-D-glutamate--2,6-diaminopimelate ligase [Nitrospiraceae bacterium]